MALTTIKRWIDYSYARPDLAVAVHDGASGAMRYICPDTPLTHGKILQPAERDAILHAGLDLLLNFEWYANRALEGHEAGLQDGRTAARMARALDYPKGADILFSVDCDTHDFAAIAAYFVGVHEGLAGEYGAGGYGSYDVVAYLLGKGLIKWGWQTLAWSKGKRDPQAVIYQDGNTWFHGQADEDLVNGPVGSWLQTKALDQQPAPKPTPAPNPAPAPTPAHPKPAPKPRPKPTPTGHRVVVVHQGDTLSAIAQRFRVPIGTIVKLNKIKDPNLIYVGEVLYLDAAAPRRGPVAAVRTVVVKFGDTLSSIAARFHTDWQRLARINHLKNPNKIDAGQHLHV